MRRHPWWLTRESGRRFGTGRPRSVTARAALAMLAAGVLVGPTFAQDGEDDPALAGCPPALGSGLKDATTVTNVLQLEDPVAPIRIDRRGAPERRRISFATRLPEEFVAETDNANFEVAGSLFQPDEGDIEGAVEVSAAPRDEDTIVVSMCVDPAPDSASALPVGEYRARIDFQDERIPETVLDVQVLVGDPSARAAYWAMVVVLALLLAGATWWLTAALVPVADPALRSEALKRSEAARLRLAALAVVAVLLVGLAFQQSSRFDTWSVSMEGFWQFLLFAYGAVIVAIGAVSNGVLKVRQVIHDLVVPAPSTVPTPTIPTPVAPVPTTTSPAAPSPTPAAPTPAAPPDGPTPAGPTPAAPSPAAPAPAPRSGRGPARRRRPAAVPALVLGLASTAVVAVAVASVIDHDDDPTATAPATTQTTAARPEPDVFDQIEYGVTDGEQAVSRLRAAGFTVFDYVVCSNSIDEPGLLRQVRLAGGGAEIVGADGTATSAADLPPGTELDVLVSSGEPCD